MTEHGSARIYNITEFRQTGRAVSGASTGAAATQREIEPNSQERSLTFAELYPEVNATSPLLSKMHELVSEALAHAVGAHEAVTVRGDLLAADEELARIAAILPELFCLRSIGDGFGMVVSALHCSLVTPIESALTADSMTDKAWVVRKTLETLSKQPFISVDQALDNIERMTDIGLVTVPEGLGALGDLIGD